MRITKARFLKSMKSKPDYPELDMPEIAICGKSNVGKSSLINLLTNNSKLAKVSGSPGKTRLVNFFILNEEFALVDLPGYGYAKVSKSEKNTWGKMMEDYFDVTNNLRAFLILLDIRHKPTADDKMMVDWAAHFGLHVIIVATKADKIAKTKRHQRLKEIKKTIDEGIDYPIVAVSALKKTGVEALLDEMEKAL